MVNKHISLTWTCLFIGKTSTGPISVVPGVCVQRTQGSGKARRRRAGVA